MDCVVVSIGGSVLVPGRDDARYIRTLSDLLLEVSKECKLFVVCGGGSTARMYINIGRELGIKEADLDILGIGATRMNARLLILALGASTNSEPALDISEAASYAKSHNIVVMGGTTPGHTTDAVAAMLAKRLSAKRVVNATNVDGVYDSDPKKNPNAKKLSKMTHEELKALISEGHQKAGPNVIFDPQGASMLADLIIPLLVCNGRDVAALKNAILGREFEGTVVG